jgi:hypothetical protein
MESLLELNNVMTQTVLETMDAQLHAQLNHCGLALANHQFVLTMAHLFVETEELKVGKNAMIEILLIMMDAAADVKKKKLLIMVLQKDLLWWVNRPPTLTACILF